MVKGKIQKRNLKAILKEQKENQQKNRTTNTNRPTEIKSAINMSEARSVCAFPGWNLSFLNYILCVLCKTWAAVKSKPQTGEGPGPTPWSSHTCTEAKSPEAHAPRIAAPTRTDSTSCDRTTGMPAQDKATPWLGSRTGHCEEPASSPSSENTCGGGGSGHPRPVPHCSLFQGIPWVYRISLPLPAGTAAKGPMGTNTI